MQLIKTTQYAFNNWGFLGTVARFLLLKSEMKRFISTKNRKGEKEQIKSMLKAFDRIQANVKCGHSPYHFVLIAKYILELEIPGPIVECGCWKGGSSAKLSILARITNRHLFICDSFAGLPAPLDHKESVLKGRRDRPSTVFRKGQYTGTLGQVKENIKNYGCRDVCTFIPGFFEDSLRYIDVKPACVIIDVDLISSARACLKYLWPQTLENGLWFTHEAIFPAYIEGILDPEWWTVTLNEVPPIIFGAGSGLSDCANSLAYFKKKKPARVFP